MENAFWQMCVTVCGRFVPNEGGVGGKGIKGNALRRLNMVQISRKVVNATHTRRYADGGNDGCNLNHTALLICHYYICILTRIISL